jgi:lipopolysaccharide transport system ATP-binding protein
MRRNGVTILFVSHDLGLVKRLADRAVLMVKGRIEAEGRPADVVNRYVGMVLSRTEPPDAGRLARQPAVFSIFRHGSGASRILEAKLLNAEGREANTFHSGETATVRLVARFERPVDNPVVGILIRTRLGVDVFGTNTKVEGFALGNYRAGEQLEARFTFNCHLTRQEYTLTVAVLNWDGTSQDWVDDILGFTIVDTKDTAGVVSLATGITWQRT